MVHPELGPSSLTDALYESIRKRIVNGEIPQGEKLTEVRLATEYQVARPTAKAALERLTALGLLRRTAHKTAAVPVLDEAEIRAVTRPLPPSTWRTTSRKLKVAS
jgi:DNA-binding GntR family transcriptional regulator